MALGCKCCKGFVLEETAIWMQASILSGGPAMPFAGIQHSEWVLLQTRSTTFAGTHSNIKYAAQLQFRLLF